MPVRVFSKYTGCLVVVLFLAFLVGCSASGGDGDDNLPGGDNNLRVSAPTLPNGANAVRAGASVPVRVTVTNASGGGRAGVEVTFSTTAGLLSDTVGRALTQRATTAAPRAEGTTLPVQTDANGIAEVILTASPQLGRTVVTAAVSGGFRTSATIFFVAGPPAQLDLVATPASVNAQGTATLQAVVLDEDDLPVAGVDVNFSTTAGTLSATPVQTGPDGIAVVTFTAPLQVGSAEVTAAVSGGVSSSTTIFFVAGPPTQLNLVATPATVRVRETATLRATVRDEDDLPVAGVTVTFSLDPRLGTLSATSVQTNPDGIAVVIFTAPPQVGNTEVTATVSGIDPSSTTIFFVAGPPAQLNLATPATVNVGAAAPLQATVLDEDDLPIVGVTVTFSTTVGTLSATSVQTGLDGIAVVNLTAPLQLGSTEVTAAVGRIRRRATIRFIAGPPTQLNLVATPATVNVGRTATLRATVLDESDLPVAGVTVNFTVETDNSGATLSSSSRVTDANGQASVAYTAGTNGGPREVTDVIQAAVGTTLAANASIVVRPPPPASINLVAPTPVIAGATVELQATVRDALSRPLEEVTVNFTVVVDSSGATLSASSGVTDANGQVRVDYTAGTEGGPRAVTDRIQAAVGTLADNARILVTPLPPASIELVATPAAVNAEELATLQATVRDALSRPLQGVRVGFVVVTNNSRSALSAASGVTDTNGQARVVYTAGTAGGTNEVTDEIQAAVGTLNANASIVVRPPPPASIALLVSSPQLDSGGEDFVTLTALVQDRNRNFLPDVPVTFSADSGGIQVTRGITNETGTAEARLSTAGDKSIRTITVTATVLAQTLTSTNTVLVTGTTISLSGPRALVLDESVTFSLLLQDSAGVGIGNETVVLRSTAGNTITPAIVVTGTNGDQTFQVTATVAGPDTIEALALGAEGSFDFIVSGDHFILTVADATQDILLNTLRPVTVHWDRAGVNQVNQAITFFITRGELRDPDNAANRGVSITKNTDANGDVAVTIISTNAGPAALTAQTATVGGPSAQTTVEFVATDPASLIVQATPTTLGVNTPPNTDQQSIVTATIRDAVGNLVKGKTISFSLTDITGGSISPPSAVTNSSGQASTVYTSGATVSAQDGVLIEACVSDDPTPPAPCDTVALTVARQQLFVTLGTSHLIILLSDTQYAKPYSVLVTDASGNPVANARVELNILATRYQKGFYAQVFVETACVGWGKVVTSTCNQEDINRNGRLDPGEDVNNNGKLEPGNVATAPGDLTTDATGFGLFEVEYAREFTWVEVELEARVTVAGSEGSSTARFFLPGAADDFNDCDVSPPGQISFFGTATTCASDQ